MAVDTNVVIRHLVEDEPGQAGRARHVFEQEDFFVTTSVMLEVDWVLRNSYGFSADRVRAAIRAIAGLPNATIENPERLHRALAFSEKGLELPDALHLAGAADCEAFATFDKSFARRAERAQLAPPVTLL